jgi:hypothetical protein
MLYGCYDDSCSIDSVAGHIRVISVLACFKFRQPFVDFFASPMQTNAVIVFERCKRVESKLFALFSPLDVLLDGTRS